MLGKELALWRTRPIEKDAYLMFLSTKYAVCSSKFCFEFCARTVLPILNAKQNFALRRGLCARTFSKKPINLNHEHNKKGGMFVFIKRAYIGSILLHSMKEKFTSKIGMTLIEVLIALIILSVGVSSMMVAMSRCLAVVRTARNLNVARSLLRQVDIENPIERKNIEEIMETGNFEDTEAYTWSREIFMVDEEERPGLFIVTTRVKWSERGKESFEEIIAYKYAPDADSVTRNF